MSQEFTTTDYLRLEIEDPDAPGVVNLIQNPSGHLGGWGWVTPIPGAKITGASAAGLTYTGTTQPGNYFTSEAVSAAAGLDY